MSHKNRDRFGPELGPPPTERAIILLLLALIVAFWIVSAFSAAKAAEPDKRPCLSNGRQSISELSHYGSRQRLPNGPAAFNSTRKRAWTDSNTDCPVRDAHRLVTVGHTNIAPPVSRLLESCQPAAFFFGVSERIVFAFECVLARWLAPHISEKNGEPGCLRSPLSANSYAPTTIALESNIPFRIAPAPHGDPGFPFGTFSGFAVPPRRGLNASAGLSMTADNRRQPDCGPAAATAIANCDEFRAIASASFASENFPNLQASILFVDEIFGYDTSRHAVAPCSTVLFRDARRGPTAAASRYFNVAESENKDDARPKIWVYSAAWCGPCKALHKAIDDKKALTQFRVIWVDVDKEGITVKRGIPQICWWKPNGKSACFTGWGEGSEAEFLAAYRKSGRVL